MLTTKNGHKLLIARGRIQRRAKGAARTMCEDGHVSAVRTGLRDGVTVVDAGCSDLYLKSSGVIVVQWGCVYFNAVRKKR